VAFTSAATNLVPGDTNGFVDVFVHDRVTGIIERVSVGSSGTEANDDNVAPSLAPDGSIVAFSGAASNLVAGDTNGCGDVFVHERCATFAMWSNYGSGFPGTNGVPSFSSRQNPGFGATITLDLANSYGAQTAGLLFVGFQRTSLHSNWGGDLLVVPALVIPIGLAIGGDSFSGTIPLDVSLCGTTVYAQAIEADPGAAKGVSFTAGLELVIGY
jgi:hypothetical protein